MKTLLVLCLLSVPCFGQIINPGGGGTVIGSGITTGVKGQDLVANGTANTLVPTTASIDVTPFLPVAPSASTDLCPYINAATTLNPFSVIDLRGLPVRTYCNFPMVTPANGQTSVIASVATSSGGSAVYTGTFPFGASNFYANPGCSIAAISAQTVAFCKVVITGFVGGNNNGTFTVSASTTTTITVNNASATTESAGATGVIGGGGNFSGKLSEGYTTFFINSYAGYQSFGSGNNVEGEGRVNSAGSIPYVPGTGTDYELCSAVGTEMAASDFSGPCGSVAMQAAIVSTDTNNYPAIISHNSYPPTSGAVGASGTTALASRISGITVGCGMLANTTGFGNYNSQEGSKTDNFYWHDCSGVGDIGAQGGGGTGGAQNSWWTDFQGNTLSGKTNDASAVGMQIWGGVGNGMLAIIEKGSVVNNSSTGTKPNYDFQYVGGATNIGEILLLGNHWESATICGVCIGVVTVKGVDQGGTANGLMAIDDNCGPGFGSGAGSGCFDIFNGVIGTGTAAVTNIQILAGEATGAGSAPLNLITDANNTSIPVATKFILRYETDGTGKVVADTSKTNASQLFATAHSIDSSLVCAAASASSSAYTCTTSPSFTPADGDTLLFKADVASAAAPTIAVNGASAAATKKQGGNTALAANDFIVGGKYLIEWDGTNWQVLSSTGVVAGANILGNLTVTSVSASNGFIDKAAGFLSVAMTTQTTATCTNVTNMTWLLAANKNYILGCRIPRTLAASATLQYCIGGPGTATGYSLDVQGANGAAGAWTDLNILAQTAYGGKTTASAAAANTAIDYIYAGIQNGATASGTALTLQTAANGTNTIQVLANASCTLTQVN